MSFVGVVHCQESCDFLGRLGMTMGWRYVGPIGTRAGIFVWKKPLYSITSNEIMLGYFLGFSRESN